MKEDIDKQLESEYTRMNKVKRIQEEIDNLNKSLANCIDLVSSSISNQHTLEKLRRLKEENAVSYSRASTDLDETIENTRQNITQLKLVQKSIEEAEEEKMAEIEAEAEKGSEE